MTARTLYSCTMSLDGFLAGPGGDMQWLTRHLGPNPLAEDLVDRIGSLLVGRRTHDGDDPHRGTDQEGAFGGQWHGPVVVLTHRPPPDAPDGSDLRFMTELEPAVTAAQTDLVKHALRKQTDQALTLGIFGAPTLITPDGELFWGNDRLEDALDWAVGRR
jgi:hypothetical protein